MWPLAHLLLESTINVSTKNAAEVKIHPTKTWKFCCSLFVFGISTTVNSKRCEFYLAILSCLICVNRNKPGMSNITWYLQLNLQLRPFVVILLFTFDKRSSRKNVTRSVTATYFSFNLSYLLLYFSFWSSCMPLWWK